MAHPARPDEDMKIPDKAGEAPRPASEPKGSEGSSSTDSTLTDPVTGKPRQD